MPRSHQHLHLVPSHEIAGGYIEKQMLAHHLHTILAGDGNKYCQKWPM